MYCPRLDAEISPEDCGKLQSDEFSDCENFEPFIWFMMGNEVTWKRGTNNVKDFN